MKKAIKEKKRVKLEETKRNLIVYIVILLLSLAAIFVYHNMLVKSRIDIESVRNNEADCGYISGNLEGVDREKVDRLCEQLGEGSKVDFIIGAEGGAFGYDKPGGRAIYLNYENGLNISYVDIGDKEITLINEIAASKVYTDSYSDVVEILNRINSTLQECDKHKYFDMIKVYKCGLTILCIAFILCIKDFIKIRGEIRDEL